MDDLLDASATEREHFHYLLLTSKHRWAHTLRKIPESRPGPSIQPKERCSFQEVGGFAKLNASPTLKGVGEILRPRQEGAIFFPTAFREGGAVGPPYFPFLALKLHGSS